MGVGRGGCMNFGQRQIKVSVAKGAGGGAKRGQERDKLSRPYGRLSLEKERSRCVLGDVRV